MSFLRQSLHGVIRGVMGLRSAGGTLMLAGILTSGAAMVGCEASTSDDDIVNVATPELAGLVDQAKLTPTALLLIDPRSRAEYEMGRIPTARNMPVTTFRTDRKRDPRIERFDQIVVYGKDPASPIGRATTKRLVELGYENVRFYGGGMEEWTLSGLAVEAGE